MASSPPWPFDDEDRPSGSVRPLSQSDLQAILADLNNEDPDELLAGTGADRPVVAVWVRASVGRPGGSAQAQWQRMRAVEWATWTRTLPWRVAATLGIGAGGGVLGSLLALRLGPIVAALAAVAAGWGLRFKPSPDAVAWRRGGGATHRPTTQPAGAARLGRPARPGHPTEPGQPRPPGHRPRWGVRDRLQALSRSPPTRPVRAAVAWRYPLAPALRVVDFEADQAAQVLTDLDVVMVPIAAVHGAQVPWGKVVTNGVPVVAARRLRSMLRELPAVLGPERVAWLADQARVRFHHAT